MIHVMDDAELVATAAATHIAAVLARAVDERGVARMALAGGSTPRRAYELLAQAPLRERVPWDAVHVFWGDERCVPPTDERSNERMAREAFLDGVALDPDFVHPIRWDGDPVAGALQYEALLRRELDATCGRLDLVILGMGVDGHTAGLFPGSPALDEGSAWASALKHDMEDHQRITLTLPLLNRATSVLVIVTGAAKRDALRRALADDRLLPIVHVRPEQGEMVWVADREAMGEQ